MVPSGVFPACIAWTWARPGPWQRWQSMPLGQFREILERFRRRRRPLQSAIAVVAEHALISDLAAEVSLMGLVVTRIHRPIALVFGVPAHGQFADGRSCTPVIKDTTGMVAGPRTKFISLDHVRSLPSKANLVTTLKNLAVFPVHRIVAV